MVCVAGQEAEDTHKDLEKEQEKRQKMMDDIGDLIENLYDLSMREIRARLMIMKGDEDIPFPEQIKRHPPTSPTVLPFVDEATQTDDEGGPADRYTRTHKQTCTVHPPTYVCV